MNCNGANTMTTKTLAAALVCLASLSAPAFALDVSLGASVGVGASTSSGGESGGLSLGLGANASANLGLGSEDSTAAGLTANADGTGSLTGGDPLAPVTDELSQVIALIESSDWTSQTLSGLSDVTAVAYDVTDWINSTNQAAFDTVLSANATEIENLQTAVSANAALEGWLEANNATAEEVIAIGVAADGSLAVFTN
jgi:hypothetical protein